jgi:histidinol-phosphate aminotransferase
LRLGYAVAHERLIDTLARHAMTFPVNALAQAAGIAALEQVDVYRRQIEELKYRRDQLQRELSQLGFSVLPSHTNFLLALAPENFVPVNPAKTLAEKGLLVSDQTSTPGISQPAIRIAVGTEKENRRLIEMIRGIIASYINVI